MGQDGPRSDERGQQRWPRRSKMGPRWAKMGPRWRQDGPRRRSLGGTKTEPRRGISPAFLQCFFAIPGCRPECAKKWPRNDKDGAKIGQDWARWGKMDPRWGQDGAVCWFYRFSLSVEIVQRNFWGLERMKANFGRIFGRHRGILS